MTSEYTDTQMLDWLDGRNRALNNHYGTEYGWKVVLSPNVTRVMTKRQPADSGYVADVDVHDSRAHGHTSVRTAITEAMRSSGIHSPGVGGSGGGKEDGAAPLRTALDLTLTRDELSYLASFLTDDVEKDDEAVRLLIGDGHSGYGLYAAHPEYPEEGAILVKELPAPAGVNGDGRG